MTISSSERNSTFFVELDKLILKFIWRRKDSRIVKTFLKKKNKVRRPALPDIKNYYKIKTVLYWHWNRWIDHWNKIAPKQIHV